jgi:hypothetical protein
MFGFNRFALLSPEGDAGGGAAEGESSEEGGSGEGQQPKDGEFVPRTQLIAALNNAEQKRERELATLRAEFEAKLAKATEKPAETPKRYSRADLLAAVANQQITQEQADTEWERQIREDALATATQAAREIVTTATRTESVTAQISSYVEAEPELKDKSSDTYQKVAEEFRALVNLGDDPKSLTTELKAIRAALGPIEKLKAAKSGRTSHEGHRETGGGGGAGPKGGQGNLKLSAKERTHYEGKVGPGKLYKDWKAVEDELKFARPETRQRHGAPV